MAENEIRLPDTSKLVVSSSPHYHDSIDVRKVMLLVIVALLPACVSGVVIFGLRALFVLAVCAVSCMAFEALFSKMMDRPISIRDCSALLTGILLGMNLSVGTPWWVCVVGALLAIGIGKMIYGGLGYNPFNPALVGRVGLLIAFPGTMTTWLKPIPGAFSYASASPDALTTATPLGLLGMVKAWKPDEIMRAGDHAISYIDCFWGNVGGCIGETSAFALLIGGIVLIVLRLIRWQVPACYIGTVAIVTGITHMVSPEVYAPPIFHILVGGLFIGAFFMATDMVTSPMSSLGAVIFGVGCGLVTCAIRLWGSYPEGVSFAILFMNALTPLIDRCTAGRPFGVARSKEAKA